MQSLRKKHVQFHFMLQENSSIITKNPILNQAEMTACMLMFNYCESGNMDEEYYVQIRLGVLKSRQNGKAIQLGRFPILVRLNSFDEILPEFIHELDRETFQRVYKNVLKSQKLKILKKNERNEQDIEIQRAPKALIIKKNNEIIKENMEEELIVSNPSPYLADYGFFVVRQMKVDSCTGDTVHQQFQRFEIEANDTKFFVDFISNKAHNTTYAVHITYDGTLQNIKEDVCKQVYNGIISVVQELIS